MYNNNFFTTMFLWNFFLGILYFFVIIGIGRIWLYSKKQVQILEEQKKLSQTTNQLLMDIIQKLIHINK